MQKLNLPEYSFRIKEENGKYYIFDQLRKKFVWLSPEEWVRQNFTRFLIEAKKYPVSLLVTEACVNINGNLLRADLVVFGRSGQPLVGIEFKAPSVKICQDTFNQLVRYNMQLRVKYLIVSNGMSHYCCQLDYLHNSYSFLEDIPSYLEMTE